MAIILANGIQFDTADLTPGVKFDTEFEVGCEVTTGPDDMPAFEPTGTFLALDHECVECQFHVDMVSWIHRTA